MYLLYDAICSVHHLHDSCLIYVLMGTQFWVSLTDMLISGDDIHPPERHRFHRMLSFHQSVPANSHKKKIKHGAGTVCFHTIND